MYMRQDHAVVQLFSRVALRLWRAAILRPARACAVAVGFALGVVGIAAAYAGYRLTEWGTRQ
jgi:hypothetical protein